MSPTLETLKLFCICAFYLGCNFVPFALPPAVYAAYQGSLACRAFVLVALVDFVVPLRMPGLSMRWCKLTNDTAGKRSYFGCELVVEAPLRKDTNYLICYHPHSLFGIAYNVMSEHFYNEHGIVTLFTGADVLTFIPILRRMLVWWGFTPASAPAMKKHLKLPYPHNALTLMPGGVAEMFYGLEDEQIILEKRKGFCKLALQTGAALVPVYAFGANQVFTRYFGPRSLAARVSSAVRTSLVVWTGRWGIPFGPVPHPCQIVVAVGAPIEVQPVEQPSAEQVQALHAQYVAALRALYERHKGKMGAAWAESRPQLFLENEKPPKKTKAA